MKFDFALAYIMELFFENLFTLHHNIYYCYFYLVLPEYQKCSDNLLNWKRMQTMANIPGMIQYS